MTSDVQDENGGSGSVTLQAAVDGAEAIAGFLPGKIAGRVLAPVQVVGTAVTEGANYYNGLSEHAQKFGKEDISRIGDGFAQEGDYRPELESESKLASNAWIGVGKGIVLAAVGLPFMAMGPLVGIPCSIGACIAANWAYDKVVGRSQRQDPLKIAEAMRDQRDECKPVAPEMMFALMISSLPPENELRQEMEGRLKAATGTHKFHKVVLERPEALPAIKLLMDDPSVNARLCEHFGAPAETNFVQHVTRLYNDGAVHTRGVMYAHSDDVALAIMDEQLLGTSSAQVPVAPPAGLPARGPANVNGLQQAYS